MGVLYTLASAFHWNTPTTHTDTQSQICTLTSTHKHAHTHTHAHIYRETHIHPHKHRDTQRLSLTLHKYTPPNISKHTNSPIHGLTPTSTQTHIQTHLHIQMSHPHSDMRTQVYTQSLTPSQPGECPPPPRIFFLFKVRLEVSHLPRDSVSHPSPHKNPSGHIFSWVLSS